VGALRRRKPVASALCTLVVAGAVSLLPVGCGGQGDSATATKASSQPDTTATKASGQGSDTTATKASGKRGNTASTEESTPGCRRVEAPKPKKVSYSAPAQTVEPGEKLTAVVKTSCGNFEIALDAKRAPKTVNSFVFLAEEGFYSDLVFNRLIRPGTLLLGGVPGGGRSDAGYAINEPPPSDLAYTKGVVAMVKGTAEPPGHFGSQFFVVLSADAGLPPEYALVGKVDRGFGVIERIGTLAIGPGKPKQTVLIERISIQRG
jgi:peptidyl-prolyl cis-trans isomerase B (cyclophilin B)